MVCLSILYYMGPMFRAERPQAGRKRQFHQIGAEIVNVGGFEADLEIISDVYYFLKSLKLQDVKIKLNDLSIISSSEGAQVREKLKSYFESHKDKLDKDSLFRLDKNVLLIFDSKAPEMQAVIDEAPWEEFAPLSDDFQKLLKALQDKGIPCEVNRRLVRGLDYYTGCVFEVTSSGLGAQDALAGGGRYDNLYGELAGPKAPCTGFSIGMERLMLALQNNEPSLDAQVNEKRVYFVPCCDVKDSNAQQITEEVNNAVVGLRTFGFQALRGTPSLKMGEHLKKANKVSARFVVIKGAEELNNREKNWQLKDMNDKTQVSVKEGDLLVTLQRKIQGSARL